VPTQRCTVHKHRNLLANAPERLHDEIAADYNDMIYGDTPESGAKPSCASGGCATPPSPTASKEPAIASSLSQHWPPSQWKSARTTNAIERLQIIMRKVDGSKTLSEKSSASSAQLVDVAA
jgi:putative transposase